MTCGVVIPAAGSSRRMETIDKTLVLLGGRPVLDWVLDAFEPVVEISEIVLAAGEQNALDVQRIVSAHGAGHRITVCRGGATRQESVAAGIARLPATVDLVLIHDAARPLVTPELIRQGIAMARQHGSAVAAIPVVDTIKQVDLTNRVLATPNRATLYAAQTPQVFRRDWLAAAYERARDLPATVTDEASLLELAGLPVYIYPGNPENLKLTTPIDLLIAEALLSERASRYVG